MSQQINLLNPALRPKRDALVLAVIAPLVVAALALVSGISFWLQAEQRSLVARDSELAAQIKATQERLQVAAKNAAGRQVDPRLVQESQSLAMALQWRRQALQRLHAGELGATAGFSAVMAGFARQAMDGLWLTALAVNGGELELSGRLLDPALLPTYIRRLNAEPVFQGRRFAELRLQEGGASEGGGLRQTAAQTGDDNPVATRRPRYTDFHLNTSAVAAAVVSRGHER